MAKRYCGTIKLDIQYHSKADRFSATLTEINDDCRFEPVTNVRWSCTNPDDDKALDAVASVILNLAGKHDYTVFNFAEFETNDDDVFKIRRSM